jgi:hypothetical protein
MNEKRYFIDDFIHGKLKNKCYATLDKPANGKRRFLTLHQTPLEVVGLI